MATRASAAGRRPRWGGRGPTTDGYGWAVRILVVSNLYPPVVRGGYEMECHDVVEHLRRRHEVTVLTSVHRRRQAATAPGVLRLLPFADSTRRTSVFLAPIAALRGVRKMRAVLAQCRPD